jgi:cytoplasmic polyadenylation element-binding protein
MVTDMHYVPKPHLPLDPRRTVFVGGLPRPTRARKLARWLYINYSLIPSRWLCLGDLAKAVEQHFGTVAYVGIDTDPELNYPKGAARVTFCATKSYVSALQSRFVRIPHGEGIKQVGGLPRVYLSSLIHRLFQLDIKPYLIENQVCNNCLGRACNGGYARLFCSDPSCLQYLVSCWYPLCFAV